MQNDALLAKVNLFLFNFKECAEAGKIDYSQVKRKTSIFLKSIGWKNSSMHNFVIENIEAKHYFRGPSDHHFISDCTVVEFGMELEGELLYVKLELILENETFTSGYMSFHPREQVIDSFPLDFKGEVK
ncbi:MAG: hypothetical protein ACK5MW_04865 [Enterococcus sp.]